MKRLRQIAAGFALSLLIAFMLTCGAELSRGTTTGKPNSLGVVIEDTNPNIDLIASVVGGRMLVDNDGRAGTYLEVHPFGMYALFNTGIMFCGNETDRVSKSDGSILSGYFAFIYRRQSPRLIQGIPCFELKSAFPIQVPR